MTPSLPASWWRRYLVKDSWTVKYSRWWYYTCIHAGNNCTWFISRTWSNKWLCRPVKQRTCIISNKWTVILCIYCSWQLVIIITWIWNKCQNIAIIRISNNCWAWAWFQCKLPNSNNLIRDNIWHKFICSHASWWKRLITWIICIHIKNALFIKKHTHLSSWNTSSINHIFVHFLKKCCIRIKCWNNIINKCIIWLLKTCILLWCKRWHIYPVLRYTIRQKLWETCRIPVYPVIINTVACINISQTEYILTS